MQPLLGCTAVLHSAVPGSEQLRDEAQVPAVVPAFLIDGDGRWIMSGSCKPNVSLAGSFAKLLAPLI